MYKYCSPTYKYGGDLFLSACITWIFHFSLFLSLFLYLFIYFILFIYLFLNIFLIIRKNQWRHWFRMNINMMQMSKK